MLLNFLFGYICHYLIILLKGPQEMFFLKLYFHYLSFRAYFEEWLTIRVNSVSQSSFMNPIEFSTAFRIKCLHIKVWEHLTITE